MPANSPSSGEPDRHPEAGASVVAVLSALVGNPSKAATYICQTEHVYEMKAGELAPARLEAQNLRTWTTVVFDDVVGDFKYGREAKDGLEADWTEEKMTVPSKGSTGNGAAGYYLHNGAIFQAIDIQTWGDPPTFMWIGPLQSTWTGTCKTLGN